MGQFILTSLPSRKNCPLVFWSTPKIARVVSVRPAPISPAKPTISPSYREKLMSRTSRPAFKFLTSKTFSPFSQVTRGNCSLISRPTMLAMILSMVRSLKSLSMMYWPSRMMVTRSTMACSSSRRWDMYTIPRPSAFSWRMIRNSSSISLAVREEVGSSMMRIFALTDRALAISTICCLETGRSPTVCLGSRSIFKSPRIRRASASISLSFRVSRPAFSRPRNMFSVTVRWRHMFNSW